MVDMANDVLSVDGKKLIANAMTYIALNKPPGFITTVADERGRETVLDLLPERLRFVKPVGRLDMYSEGLLILTNDGDFDQLLTHHKHHLPKLYFVKVKGQFTKTDFSKLRRGVVLEDGLARPATCEVISCNKTYSELEITLTEGRNRQIRRMFSHLGYPVIRLVRLAIGRLQLGQIESGTWRYLTGAEVTQLRSQGNRNPPPSQSGDISSK